MSTPMKVFWSWQSDYSPKTNQHFMRDVLKDAIDRIHAELDIEEREEEWASLDHDTQGVAGAVEITRTLLEKIQSASVFVADVTPICATEGEGGKAVPNPNVMFEAGWAMASIGETFMIFVLNEASGYKPKDLPFDIQGRRIFTYALNPDATSAERKSARNENAGKLAAILKGYLERAAETPESEDAPHPEILKFEAEPENPSIWKGGLEPYRNGAPGAIEDVKIMDVPRAYLRVVPAGWAKGKPRVSEIKGLIGRDTIARPDRNGGNYGVTDFGYNDFWYFMPDRTQPRLIRNVAMWIEDTGEMWATQGSVFNKDDNKNMFLANKRLAKDWAATLQSTLNFMSRAQADDPIWVEAGIFGAKGSVWATASPHDQSYICRKNHLCFSETHSNWDKENCEQFWVNVFNEIMNGYGLDLIGPKEWRELACW